MTVTGNPRIRKDEPLYVIFERFSQFGNKTVYTSADTNQASRLQAQSKDPAILDGTRFVKLFKDAGIMDAKVIHTTELDIIFNKVKGKSERRITFTQFREACRLVARKKYLLNSPSTTAASVDEEDLQDSNDTITPATEDLKEKEALQKLDDLLLKCSGPTLVSTTVSYAD